MVPQARRRVAALVLLLLALAAIVVVAVLAVGGGGGDDPKVPEGGSAFAVGDRERDDVTLLDALAPLLAAGTTTAAAPATTAAAPAPRPARKRPRAGDPVTAEEVAQLFMVGFRGLRPTNPFFARLGLRRWGAVVLDGSNVADEVQFRTLTAQAVSTLTAAGGTAPLIVVDQGGGRANAVPGVGPPAQDTVGSRAEARGTARSAGQRLRALGVRMVLGPNADIGYEGGAWAGRAFSDDPSAVARRVSGAVRGWRTAGVAPAVGHFPGEGSASQDPGDGPATVGLGLPELRRADVRAFHGALAAAPALVMSNALYAAYDGVTPATLLPEVPALARKEGFRGVVVSGNLAATVLTTGGSIADAAVDALKAGCDLLWIPGDAGDQEAAYRAVVRAVRVGAIPRRRVRAALAHVTALKRKFAAAGT